MQKENGKFLGRKPSLARVQFEAVRTGLLDGKGAGPISKELGLNRHVVIRIARNVEQADATLAAWGM